MQMQDSLDHTARPPGQIKPTKLFPVLRCSPLQIAAPAVPQQLPAAARKCSGARLLQVHLLQLTTAQHLAPPDPDVQILCRYLTTLRPRCQIYLGVDISRYLCRYCVDISPLCDPDEGYIQVQIYIDICVHIVQISHHSATQLLDISRCRYIQISVTQMTSGQRGISQTTILPDYHSTAPLMDTL